MRKGTDYGSPQRWPALARYQVQAIRGRVRARKQDYYSVLSISLRPIWSPVSGRLF